MSPSDRPAQRWINGIEPSKELLAMNGTQILEWECREQPDRLKKLVQEYSINAEIRSQLQKIARLSSNPGPVMFVGMGGSYCSSISGSIHLQSHGRSSFTVDAGEWLHYANPVWTDAALSVLVTTSGESAELVELFNRGKDRPLALICNNTASTCWQMTSSRLPILAGPEYGNATKTYTNSTAASIILTSEILGLPWRSDASRVADVLASDLNKVFTIRADLESFCRGAANIEIIGRGAAYGGAIMSALCLREMSGLRAAPHTGAGFRHGPNLDVDSTHVAVIFALGRAADLGVKLAQECTRRGGKAVLISNEDRDPTPALFPVKIEAVPEPWEGITSLIVPQALTLAIVERTGCRLPPRFQYGVMEQ